MNRLSLNLGLIIATSLGIWLPLPYSVRLIAVVVLVFFWPGWLLLEVIKPPGLNKLEHIVLAFGISSGLITLGLLGLLYIAGRLSTASILIMIGAVILILAIIAIFRQISRQKRYKPANSGVSSSPSFSSNEKEFTTNTGHTPDTRIDVLCFLIPMSVAAFLSFTNLPYSDFAGDEMNGILRAISIIFGRIETIFEHTKGPIEVFVPAVSGSLLGRFEPFTLRFPFALAFTVSSGSLYLLGRHLFNRRVGFVAALLLAINGLYIAFARLVQYQAFVLLLTILTLLLIHRYYQTGKSVHLYLGVFLAGVGLLGHYDILLTFPAVVYLVWQRQNRYGINWPQLVKAGIIFGATTAIFYVPFFFNPHIAHTSGYLERRIFGGTTWPGNNFDELYEYTVSHNSRYYATFIALLSLGLIITHLGQLLRRHNRNHWLWLAAGTTLFLELLAVVGGWPAIAPLLVTMLLFGLLIGFSDTSTEIKMVYVWIGAIFIGYVLVADHPRTHLRILYPGLSLLAALGGIKLIADLQVKLPPHWVVTGAVLIFLGVFGISAGYQYLLFVDTEREYVFTYPEHKKSIFWEDKNFPFGARRLYGAPYRLGWQMLNQLYLQGHFQGEWDSNDDGTSIFWYTLGAPRNPCYPRYYFLTQFEQRKSDPNRIPNLAGIGYVKIGQVYNHDRLEIEVYEFAPTHYDGQITTWTEPDRYASYVTPQDFRSYPYEEEPPLEISNPLSVPIVFRPASQILQQLAEKYDPRIVNVPDTIGLIGYELDTSRAKPGGLIWLTLYWQAVEPTLLPYKIFAHLENKANELWAQADDFPACGTRPTNSWWVEEIITDRHVLRLPEDIPPGDYLIRVGLYIPQIETQLDRLDAAGNPQGTSYELIQVTVSPTG
ncbi:MAG: glycosyltransferase family 39 protein [Anaerolineae bacterium]|nr:glycosyltransferase family 39 protein [Anaerolineae bacterium]